MKDFGSVASVKFSRSRFDLSHGVKTSLNIGDLVPLDIQEVLPGDSFNAKITAVCRLTSTLLKPVMDNMYLDIFSFFVPLRLLYDKAEGVFGNPNPSQYNYGDLETIPTIASGTVSVGSIGNYLGLPVGVVPDGISVLPFRCYAKVYNDWFRNENVTDEVYVSRGELTLAETLNDNPFSNVNYMGKPAKVNKKKDYFTSCLPAPQKGVPPAVSLGGSAPVVGNVTVETPQQLANVVSGIYHPMNGLIEFGSDQYTFPAMQGKTLAFINNQTYPSDFGRLGFDDYDHFDIGDYTKYITYSNLMANVSGDKASGSIDSGAYADLSQATAMNINDLRFAFQLQKMLERDALYGSRYNEYLLGHFGVVNPDSRLQFSEYLGGGRIPLGVTQVPQTSAGTEDSPQANLSAYSLSNGFSKYSKGFTEHGYVLTVGCIRYTHTYAQGIHKLFSRTKRNDFYDPLYANLGEQPVYESELYIDPEKLDLKGTVFGYNEAWAEYRFAPSRISGQVAPNVTASENLAIWTFADLYDKSPTLSDEFIQETPDFVDRSLSVEHSYMDSFLLDLWFDLSAIRVMPTYSVPGLIDHH